uniref:Enoyl reductase (ER) domain-containing protein n=1 Tax=Meloidogyne floridensis TaxID=298350 RepID=A0A915NN63_9BILA
MLAYGRLPPDTIPGQFADSQALATSVACHNDFFWGVPEEWSLQNAATVPVAFATAYYALVMRGRISKGDEVLIHSGTGGVGQAAIQIALEYGCEVYTTVSNKDKREFLQQRFPQLKDHHFANSRTTDFEQHIRRQTFGRGHRKNVIFSVLSKLKNFSNQQHLTGLKLAYKFFVKAIICQIF